MGACGIKSYGKDLLRNLCAATIVIGPFLVLPAYAQTIEPRAVVSCVVLPWETIALAAPSEGVISKIFVDRGDTVEAGDLLIQLDDRIQRSYHDLMQARADDQSAVELAKIRLQVAQAGYDRNRPLFERQQITGDDWDRIRGSYQMALVELQQMENAVAQARLELARASAALSQAQIVAPTDAVVIQRRVSVGEAAAAEPLLDLAVIDRLRAEVFARAETMPLWSAGQTVSLSIALPEPSQIEAVVRTVNAVSDVGTGVIGVLLEIPNEDGAILPGQQCQLVDMMAP